MRLARIPAWVPGAACLVFVGLAVAAAIPERSPLAPEHAGGATSLAWTYLGALTAAFVAYLAGIVALERAAPARVGVVVTIAAAIQLAPLAAPVVISTDVYTYWDYARISVAHDGNAYRDTPSEFPQDPAFGLMGSRWYDTTTVYGPAFTLGSEGAAVAAGESSRATAWTYKVVAALSMVALVLLAARLGPRPAFAAAFVGWNPLLAVHFAGGGHNDALMMAFVLGGIALAASGRQGLAGAAWAVAIAVKWVPLVWVPLRALEAHARRRPVRATVVGFFLAAALIAGAATWRYGAGWIEAFGPLAGNLRDQARYSIPNRLVQLFSLPEDVAAGLMLGVFALAYLWLLREAWRGRARLGLAGGLLLVCASWLVPWYAVWAVPLAALEEDRAARWLALGLSAYLLSDAVPV